MDAKKPYVVAVIIQLIYTGLYVVSKAAFDQGMNTFVFMFYRQAAATVLLLPLAIILERRNASPMSFWLLVKIFLYALLGNTIGINLYNVSLKYTSATVGSATSNSVPVITFFLALLLRMESMKLRSSSGVAKAAGMALCLAGVLVIAFYAGPAISPLNHHRVFAAQTQHEPYHTKGTWIKGTLLMLLGNMAWSLWLVLQVSLLKEYPNKLLVTLMQCLFSTIQSCLLAMAVERDFTRWRLRLDVRLVAVAYSGFIVTGVSFYLQAWCIEKKGPVFLAMSNPLALIFTIFCSSFFLGEIVHVGSVLGGIFLVGGLYSVLWAKSKENMVASSDCKELEQKDQEREVKEFASSPIQQV